MTFASVTSATDVSVHPLVFERRAAKALRSSGALKLALRACLVGGDEGFAFCA